MYSKVYTYEGGLMYKGNNGLQAPSDGLLIVGCSVINFMGRS